jgi:hypothetical protein
LSSTAKVYDKPFDIGKYGLTAPQQFSGQLGANRLSQSYMIIIPQSQKKSIFQA